MTPIRARELPMPECRGDTIFYHLQLAIGCIELHDQEVIFSGLGVNRGVVGPGTRTRMIPMPTEPHTHGSARGALIGTRGQAN